MMRVRPLISMLITMAVSAGDNLPYDHWLAQSAYDHYTSEGQYLFEHRLMDEPTRAEYQRLQTYWGWYACATNPITGLDTKLKALAWLKGQEYGPRP